MDWFGGKTALVTGAAHGIGRGIAEELDRLGARVVALDRDQAALEASFGDGRIARQVADIAADRPEDIIASVGEPVEILVNNVGIDTPHGFLDLDEEHFDLVIRTNLRGPWFLTRAVGQGMVQRGNGGSILFTSSLHDHIARRRPHYSASKAAVAMLVRELALELGPHGIRVNAVSPGVIGTASVPPPSPEESERLRELVPLGGRQGRPEDVARVAAVLLSDAWCGYVTGANVPVDGGLDLVTWSRP